MDHVKPPRGAGRRPASKVSLPNKDILIRGSSGYAPGANVGQTA